MNRFVIFEGITIEELVAKLNETETLFSSVVYFGVNAKNRCIAVLDFNFSPVITYTEIDIARRRMKEQSEQFIPTLSA